MQLGMWSSNSKGRSHGGLQFICTHLRLLHDLMLVRPPLTAVVATRTISAMPASRGSFAFLPLWRQVFICERHRRMSRASRAAERSIYCSAAADEIVVEAHVSKFGLPMCPAASDAHSPSRPWIVDEQLIHDRRPSHDCLLDDQVKGKR